MKNSTVNWPYYYKTYDFLCKDNSDGIWFSFMNKVGKLLAKIQAIKKKKKGSKGYNLLSASSPRNIFKHFKHF